MVKEGERYLRMNRRCISSYIDRLPFIVEKNILIDKIVVCGFFITCIDYFTNSLNKYDY